MSERYLINPGLLWKKRGYKGLRPIARLVYREILDLCWMSSEKSSIPFIPSELSSELNLSKDEVEEAVNEICDEAKLLRMVIDSSGAVVLVSDYLESQREADEESEWRSRQNLCSNNRNNHDDTNQMKVSALSRVSGKGKAEAIIGYLSDEEAKNLPEQYSGWLPTREFPKNGQIYYVREDVLNRLQEVYPNRDILEDLQEMFLYLIDENTFCPRAPRMNQFIARWIQRAVENHHKNSRGVIGDQDLEGLDEQVSRLIEKDEF